MPLPPRKGDPWDMLDITGCDRTGWYFTLNAVSSNSSDDRGAQPVTVKGSRSHWRRLFCLTCPHDPVKPCKHVRFTRRYIDRFSTPAGAQAALQSTQAWMQAHPPEPAPPAVMHVPPF